MSNKKKSQNNITLILFFTRLLVFIRDILMVSTFGINAISDMFFIILKISAMFKNFLSEGSMNLAFIPNYTKKLNNSIAASEYAKTSFLALLVVLLIIIVPIEIFTGFFLTKIMKIGNLFDINQNVIIFWTQISFVYILISSMSSFVNSILCTHDCYIFSFIGSILMNVLMISMMVVLKYYNYDLLKIGTCVIYTMLIATFIYLIILSIASRQYNFLVFQIIYYGFLKNITFARIQAIYRKFTKLKALCNIKGNVSKNWHCFLNKDNFENTFTLTSKIFPLNEILTCIQEILIELKKIFGVLIYSVSSKNGIIFMQNFIFAILWIGLLQVTHFIDMFFLGKFTPGSTSILFYAEKVSRFPGTLISIPLTLIVLPIISKAISSNAPNLMDIKMSFIKKNMFITFSIALILYYCSYFINYTLFCFFPFILSTKQLVSHENIVQVSEILSIFAIGLPSLIMFRIFSIIGLSYNNKSLLFFSALLSIFIKFVSAFFLIKILGVKGIAYSTVITEWTGCLVILFNIIILKMLDFKLFITSFMKVLFALTIMFICLYCLDFSYICCYYDLFMKFCVIMLSLCIFYLSYSLIDKKF